MAYIRELDSGKWQAVIRRTGNKPVSKSFSTKSEAGQWARLIESEIDRGVFVDRTEGERTTIGELIDLYLIEAPALGVNLASVLRDMSNPALT